jgi:acetyl esterase/lipase
MALLKSALAVMAAVITSTAWAQQSPMPEDLAWKLLELGRVIDPPKTAALYAPIQEKEPYQGVRIERDVKYGPADRHLLDVFMPETGSSLRPVLIFIQGGAFVGGNKRTPGSPFYDNIMLWAVKSGFVGVNATYHLAPQSPWPAGAEDLAAVVQWVSGQIGERGGDPARYAERSSVQGLLATKIPLMISATELDPPRFVEQFELLNQAMCKRPSGCVHSFMLPQHSHMSEVFAINTADTRLTDEILDFVKTGK